MAVIDVNHKEIGKAAGKVDDYVSTLKRKMREANSEVQDLSSAWKGNDEKAFEKQWKKVDDAGSVYASMIEAFEGYSKNLKAAESLYKEAQIDALDRANKI